MYSIYPFHVELNREYTMHLHLDLHSHCLSSDLHLKNLFLVTEFFRITENECHTSEVSLCMARVPNSCICTTVVQWSSDVVIGETRTCWHHSESLISICLKWPVIVNFLFAFLVKAFMCRFPCRL